MSVLGDLRADIAATLLDDTDIPALSYIPGRIVPPIYLVSQGTPYITSGDTFGSFSVQMQVEVVSPTASNDTNTESLDSMIEEALVSVSNSGCSVVNVTQPFQLDVNNATYLASTINISKTISL
jgi:hypothetical protein